MDSSAVTKADGMLRSSCFSFGAFVLLCGISLLYVDRLVLDGESLEEARSFRGMLTQQQLIQSEKRDVLDPPDWAAFALMSLGSVTMLYSAALPRTTTF